MVTFSNFFISGQADATRLISRCGIYSHRCVIRYIYIFLNFLVIRLMRCKYFGLLRDDNRL